MTLAMIKKIALILTVCSSLMITAGCASSSKTSESSFSSDTHIFNGKLSDVVNLAAKAIKVQGMGIDDSHPSDSGYVIIAHLKNEYMFNSPYSGGSDNAQEAQVKVLATYINEAKTKLYIDAPEPKDGVSHTYQKNISSKIFRYINKRLK